MPKFAPPRENLYRAVYALQDTSGGTTVRALTLRDAPPATGGGDGRTLQVQWSVADQWTEIDSMWEGNFMERVAPGAAKKTIKENAPNMRILLQHGRDPSIGEKPIAPVDLVEENALGGYGEGRLFDGLDPLVVDGLRAGQYGASFRFRVMREELVDEPGVSDYNPKGLPERTIKEMAVQEFGPVTWGAYGTATSGVRSITDEIHFATLRDIPEARLRALVGFWENRAPDEVRVDSEDIGTLAQMLTLATAYIDDQDETDDAVNIPAMQAIQSSLIDLLNVEVSETEPPENEDEEAAHAPSEATESRENNTEAPAVTATPKVTKDYLTLDTPEWQLP